MLSQAPKAFTLCGVPEIQELACPVPHDLHRAMMPRGFLSPDPPHWVWPRELLYSGPGALKRWDTMVVET
jgi:hypothetical protein